MNLTLVPYTHVDQVWSDVAPMMARALTDKASHGEATIDQIRMAIVQKDKHLVVASEGEEIIGAATIEFMQYPNKRIALMGNLGGKGVCTQEALDTIKHWCKEMGASELRAFAKDAQTRLYVRFGLEPLYHVVGVPL